MYRYIAVTWAESDSHQAEAAKLIRERVKDTLHDMHVVAAGDGFIVLAERMRPRSFEAYQLIPDHGVVLGRLFHRDLEEDAVPQRVVLDEAASEAIVATAGHQLLQRYWGRYVAFVHDDPTCTMHVIRDPSGGIPCFVSSYQGARIVFSCMEDCISLGIVSFSINWRYVYACLTGREVQSQVTGLNEVLHVRQGERIELRPGRPIDRALCWNPMRISETDPIEDPQAAVIAARHTTRACIAAWAFCYPRILLRYSAGFDSTIVLCSLRHAASRPTVACLHYFDPPVDEREHEYLHRAINGTAKSRGESIEVIERTRAPENVRLDTLLNVRRFACLPYYKSWLMNEPLDCELARERGAALFDGVYGNQLFLTDTLHAAIDYVWRHPSGKDVFRASSDSTPEATLWTAVGRALKLGLVRLEQSGRLEPSDYPFVNRAVFAGLESNAEDYRSRYWRQHPSRGVPPGKLSHIGMMCMPSDMNIPFQQSNDPERVTPLLSQPLMELFLRIPTYVLSTGGMDRAVARQAFSEYLPSELLTRSMVEIGHRPAYGDDHRAVLHHNEAFIRQILLEGVLAREGLLNRDAVERYLADFRDRRALADVYLLETYFDLEIWLQSWKSVIQGHAADLRSADESLLVSS